MNYGNLFILEQKTDIKEIITLTNKTFNTYFKKN